MPLLLLTSIIAISSTCSKMTQDDRLSLTRTNYSGNELRIDGYYYQKYGDPERLTIYFFFSDGILLHAGDGYTIDIEESFKDGSLYEKLKKNKYCWGLFRIEDKNIQIERYYNTDDLSKKSYIRSGEILNDTTFSITKVVRSDGESERSVNETYHFKQFSPKPDSTNIFIK